MTRTRFTTPTRRHRQGARVVVGVIALTLLTGCAGTTPQPAKPLPAPTEQALNTACPDLSEKYRAALESTSTGLDHPDNYTVQAVTEEAMAAELPDGALDRVDIDCVVSVHSSVVESTQVLGVVLNPSGDEITSVRAAIAAAGWEKRGEEEGVFIAPEPDIAGAQTYEIDEATAEQIGIPGPAFVINAGRWDLWGAF